MLTARWRGPGCPAWHLAWHPRDTVARYSRRRLARPASRARTISSVPIRVVASTISSVTSAAAPSWSPRCRRSRTSAATGPALPAVGLVVVVRARRPIPPRLNASSFLRPATMLVSSSSSAAKATSAPWQMSIIGTSATSGGQPVVEVGEVGVAGAFRDEAGAQSPVSDLPSQPKHCRRHRGQVDRNDVLGPSRQPHRHRAHTEARDLKLVAGV